MAIVRRFVVMAAMFIAISIGHSAMAVTLVNGGYTNLSYPDQAIGSAGRTQSWQTANSLGSVVTGTSEYTLSNHFMFNNAQRVIQPEGANYALVQQRIGAYRIDFSISDPASVGYEVIIETNYRGYVTARSDNGIQINSVAGSMAGYIDTDLNDATDTLIGPGPNMVTNMTNIVGGTSTTGPLVNVLKQSSKTYSAGTFSGSRDMAIRFSHLGSNNNVFLQNFGAGEGAVRFGLNPVQPKDTPTLQISGYPNIDGEDASQHGHFVNIIVRPVGGIVPPLSLAIPEPASAVLALVSVMALGLRRRRA